MASTKQIETAILNVVGTNFRKTAFVVGAVMTENPSWELADSDVQDVVIGLIKKGQLSVQGDPGRMQFSEVKLS